MSFIDANVIVCSAVNDPRQEEATIAILGGGFTNTLALAEAHRAILKITHLRKAADATILRISKHLEIVPVTEDTISDAMLHTEIDIFDAIHVVTANGAEFITYDKQLKEYAKKR